MSNKMSARDRLRAKTIGAKTVFKSEVIEWEGEEFEMRQPSIKGRAEIREKIDPAEDDVTQIIVRTVIACTYVPGTDERIYDDTDYDALMNLPSDGFVDEFYAAAARLLNVDTQEVKKRLEETQSDSSSSI